MSMNEGFTKGTLGALSKNRNRATCDCGFPMPVYPGRYPSACPVCDEPRSAPAPVPEDEGEEDGA